MSLFGQGCAYQIQPDGELVGGMQWLNFAGAARLCPEVPACCQLPTGNMSHTI